MKYSFNTVITRALKIIAFLYLLVSVAFGIKLAFSHLSLPMDFGSFMASGLQALEGKNPYSYDAGLVFTVPIRDYKLLIPSPNLNPPLSILPFQLLAAITSNPIKDAVTWKILSLIGYLLFVCYLMQKYDFKDKWLTVLWLCSLAGFWQTIEVGQIYVPLLMLTLLGWIELEKQNFILSGIYLGILTAIKPQFIIWIFFILLAKKKLAVMVSSSTAFVLSMIPVFFYGFNIYVEWLKAISQYTGVILPGNTSLQSLFTRLGLLDNNLITAVIFLLVVTVYIILTKPALARINNLSVLTVLLVSPYSWVGYTLFLLPIYLRKMEWTWRTKLSAALFAFPTAFILEYYTKGIVSFLLVGWIYGWAVLLLFWDEVDIKNEPVKNVSEY
jgi:hypothetical protein